MHRDLKEVREGTECTSVGGALRHREQPGMGHDAGAQNQRARKVCPDGGQGAGEQKANPEGGGGMWAW